MHVLVVVAHPRKDSLTQAASDKVCSGLLASGCTLELADLYAENFDPRLNPPDEPDWDDAEKEYSAEVKKEVARIELPKIAPGKTPVLEGGNASHGMAVTADGKVLVVDSRLNSALYSYSLPDLKLLGAADVGVAPDWVTLSPDGKNAYVANAGSNSVSVVDIKSMKEITRIPVGQVPKRNITAMLQN